MPPFKLPSLSDHARYESALARRDSIERQFADVQRKLNEPAPADDSRQKMADAILSGMPARLIPTAERGTGKAELYDRLSALAVAREMQKAIVRRTECEARRELIADHDLQGVHGKKLQAVADAARLFGEACSNLDDFYAALEASGLGGACLGHHGWPEAFNPGRLSDPNSNLMAWHKEVRAAGHKLQVKP